ncbi:hypothetical protein ACOME3_007550 [Neoechinorhynchus agilis]
MLQEHKISSYNNFGGDIYHKGKHFCSGNHDEMFFGNAGAFRCLNEGKGNIAFVSHWTVPFNTDARNDAQWARHLRSDDFEILCRDGRRRPWHEWHLCFLSKVKGKVLMMSSARSQNEIQYTVEVVNNLLRSVQNP